MATTLVQFAEERRDALAQRKDDAFTEFETARGELDGPPDPGLRKALAAKTAELTDVNRRIEQARRALGGDLTPAELEARVDALRVLIAERRTVRVELLDLEESVALTERELERSRAAHREAGAAHAGAETRLAEESARAKRLARWQGQLEKEPLVSLPERAGKLRTEEPDNEDFVKAQERVEGAIPETLRARAIERYDQQLARLTAARDALAEAEAALAESREEIAGPAAEVAAARAELARAEEALGDFVVRGPERLEMARGMLASVAAGTPPTDAEMAAVEEPALVAAGEDAAEKEGLRDQAREALATAEAALEAKKLELQAADVDVDLDADSDVSDLQDDVDQAAQDLADAENDYTEAMRDALDAWEAAVLDGIWSDLLIFERARRILEAIENTDVEALVTKVAQTEEALVDALETEDKALRTVDFLRLQAERRRQRLRISETVQNRRAAEAVRGDR